MSKMHLFSQFLYLVLISLVAWTVSKQSEQIRCGGVFGVSPGVFLKCIGNLEFILQKLKYDPTNLKTTLLVLLKNRADCF